MNLKTFRAAGLLVLSFCWLAPAWPATPVEETQALIDRGDLDGALKRIDSFLAGEPKNAEGRFTRALILVKQNKTAEAIKAFTNLSHDYPQLPEPYNNVAVLHAQVGDYAKARDALEAAVAANPGFAPAQENLGDIYAALAGAAYKRALAIDQNAPNHETARYKLSLINRLETDPDGRIVTGAPAVLTTLDGWALAWSSHDVDAYFSYYAPDFEDAGGLSRGDWEALRRARIGRADSIGVHLIDPAVQLLDAQHARVRFTQDFQFDQRLGRIAKVLDLRNIDGAWKIVHEVPR